MKFILIILLVVTGLNCQGQPTDKEVMNAFKQGNVKVKKGGNCVSIALIKAGFSKFQHDLIKIVVVGDKYNITLQDGSLVSLTTSELNTARTEAAFKTINTSQFAHSFKEYAEICFATMAKKLQKIEKYATYEEAITDLNDGFSTPKSFELLGLNYQKLDCHCAACLDNEKNLVVHNGIHAVYASDGFYDKAGNGSGRIRLKKLKWKSFGIKCSWRLCTISGAYEIIE